MRRQSERNQALQRSFESCRASDWCEADCLEEVHFIYLQRGGTWPSEALLRYVMRSQQSVILADASRPNLFSTDSYLRREQCYTWRVNFRSSGRMF